MLYRCRDCGEEMPEGRKFCCERCVHGAPPNRKPRLRPYRDGSWQCSNEAEPCVAISDSPERAYALWHQMVNGEPERQRQRAIAEKYREVLATRA